jgi:hypothetical protein
MTRQLLVELPDEVAVNAENEAKRSSRPVGTVVQEALVEYLGWRAVEQVRVGNTDLDETEADRLAYAQLAQLRAEQAAG